MKYSLLILSAALGLPALAQERVPGAEQHVTVPSAPGQRNQEKLVLPSNTMTQAKCGRILREPAPGVRRDCVAGRRRLRTRPSARRRRVRAAGLEQSSRPGSGRGAARDPERLTRIRSRSSKNGRQREVALAPRALVCQGLKSGDEVVLRIPFDEGADCRTADRVERPPAPKAPPKSKFSQAQSPGT